MSLYVANIVAWREDDPNTHVDRKFIFEAAGPKTAIHNALATAQEDYRGNGYYVSRVTLGTYVLGQPGRNDAIRHTDYFPFFTWERGSVTLLEALDKALTERREAEAARPDYP